MGILSHEQFSIRKATPSSWLSWCIALTALAVTALFSWKTARTDRALGEGQFDNYVDHTLDEVTRRLDSYTSVLEATDAHLTVETETSADVFYRYVEQIDILKKLPAIEAIGFVAPAPLESYSALHSRMTHEGATNFRAPPEPQSLPTAPILYMYPQTTLNRQLIGYDLMADQGTKIALERAAGTHAPVASGKLLHPPEIAHKKGSIILVFHPVYYPLSIRPDTSSGLAGWIFLTLRTDILLQSLSEAGIHRMLHQALHFTVHEGERSTPDTLLYDSIEAHSDSRTAQAPQYTTTRTLEVAGRTWTFAFASQPEFEAWTQSSDAMSIALLGTGFSVLLLITAQVSSASHRRVLRQREWLRVTLESIGDAVIATDANRKVLFLNSSAEALTGWRQSEAIGAASEDVVRIVEPGSCTLIEDIATQALRKGSSLELIKDLCIERRDGSLVPIQDSASPIRDMRGHACGTILVLHDISNRKRRERLETASAKVIRILAYSRSLDQSAQELITEISAGLQSDAGALWTFGESSDYLTLRASTGLQREDYEFAWETTTLQQPFWLDLHDAPATPMVSVLAEAGYRTAIGIPILTREQPKGAVTLLSRHALHCQPEIMHWLSSLGLQIGHLAQLRQEDTRRQAIIEGAFDSIISFDPHGTILDANESAQRMFHRSRLEMQQATIDTLIEVPDLLVLLRSPAADQSRTNRFLRGTMRAPDGDAAPIELTISQVVIEGEFLYTAFIRHIRADEGDRGVQDAILNNLTEGVSLADENGAIIFANKGLERMLDYDDGELIGKTTSMLFSDPPESLPALIRTPRADPLGIHIGAELACTKKNGARITTSTQASLITFSGATYLLMVQSDITETKRWQSALIESEHRFRTMANNLPILIWVSDHTHRITWLNTFLLEFCGLSGDGALDTVYLDRIHPEDRPGYEQTTGAAMHELREFEIEYRLRRSDGSYRWIWEHASPLYEAEHTLTGYLGSGVDITHRKEAEQDRVRLLSAERAARSQFERANQIKDDFLATLSHELRTPLNSILGWTHMIRKDAHNPERLKLGIEIIDRNAKAQAKMIGDLLDMSRILSGKVRIEAKPTDPLQIISSAVETVAPTALTKGIKIHLRADTALGIAEVDPDRLHQVLLNLLSNAVRFSKPNSSIDVIATPSDTEISISIRDYGDGIPPEFLPYVFDRFRQADSSTTRKHGGLGLGLAIVKHIVELHGGQVTAESTGNGHGATFTITLPRNSAPRMLPASGALQAHAADPAHSTHHRTLQGLRILVLDDEQDTRELLELLLEDEGAAVTTAASVERAFAAISLAPPDLVVSDISMPDEDGFQFIRKLRALAVDRGGSVPAIALTALARPEDRDHALAAGFQAHLSKPLTPAALIQTVTDVIAPH